MMLARLFALKLFAAILFTVATPLRGVNPPSPADLPNDCGIIAAEAYSRLKATGQWTRVMEFKAILLIVPGSIAPIHHVVVAYQYDIKSNVLLFDSSGTAELQTTSHEITNIVAAFQKFSGLCITEAHFLTP